MPKIRERMMASGVRGDDEGDPRRSWLYLVPHSKSKNFFGKSDGNIFLKWENTAKYLTSI
jgi:hypothetical protein